MGPTYSRRRCDRERCRAGSLAGMVSYCYPRGLKNSSVAYLIESRYIDRQQQFLFPTYLNSVEGFMTPCNTSLSGQGGANQTGASLEVHHGRKDLSKFHWY